MNAVSLLLAAPAPLSASKMAPPAPGAKPMAGSAFQGELEAMIEEPKGQTKNFKRDNAGQGAKSPHEEKKPQNQRPAPVVIAAPPVPPPLPPLPRAALGSPSAGVEPGTNPAKASTESKPLAAQPAGEALAAASMGAPAPPPPAEAPDIRPQAAQSKPLEAPIQAKMELAFALKLADQPSNNSKPAQSPISAAPLSLTPPKGTRAPAPAIATAGDGGASNHSPANTSQEPAKPSQSQSGPETKATHPSANAPEASSAPAPASAAAGAASPVSVPAPSHVAVTAAESAGAAAASAPAPRPVAIVAEPPVPVAPKAPVTDVSITFPVERPDASTDDRVAIRLVQKGEEIHVSVRTPDPQLTQALRQDLGKLGSELDQAGFHTETWRPTAVSAVAAPLSSNLHHDTAQGNSNPDLTRRDASGGRHAGGGSEEQRRRQPGDRPRWVDELEQQTSS